jgi:hypothetical protein
MAARGRTQVEALREFASAASFERLSREAREALKLRVPDSTAR